MNRNIRRAEAALDRIEKAAPVDSLEAIRECRMALELLAGKRKRIAQALPGVSRKAAKEAKRLRHREETAAIREAVFKRAGGICERNEEVWDFGTDSVIATRCTRPAEHLHHLRGGVGRRRQLQSVATCVALCADHHREEHRASKRAPPGGPNTRGET